MQFGQGKDIIFLHGWGGSTVSFLGVANQISDQYRVTLVDFYGFGKTPHPDYPLFVEDYAKSVVEIINKFKMSGVIIVGHSFGGRVAIRLASKWGYLLDKLVLIDSAGIKPRRGIKYYYRVYRHKLLKKLHITHQAGSEDYNALSPIARESFKNIVNEDLTSELKKITMPTLLIWGNKDKDTPIYMARRMLKQITGSALIVFENAGHYSYLDGFRVFVSILKSFSADGQYGFGGSFHNLGFNDRNIVKISLPRTE
ncbi:MAG: alpha/beta hydrolase [Clostridia bacterium]|nr:alpha/beta hydrolase [Clostridia bacterium]